jgi:pimeloyl-ACP methyl ester carboxylesterase
MPTVETKQSTITYSETGKGEPVVLVHCSSASGTEWTALCHELGDTFRCIMPDQWSCGQSDPWPGYAPFTLAEEAAPIAELIDRLESPVHLVGHSYGGGVALRIARERPAMIRSLTLVEPSIFHVLNNIGPEEQELYREILNVAEVVKRAVGTGDFWGGMSRFVDYWNGAGAWDAMPVEARVKLSRRLAKVVLDFRALFAEPATLGDYGTLACPTLILCGERSPGPSRRIVEMLGESMVDVQVREISGAGHMSPLTHPDAVNPAIAAHIEAMSSQRRMAA